MYAIKFPNGKLDKYCYENIRSCWFQRGYGLMVHTFGDSWESKFWKRERASMADFRKKGYKFVKVKLVEV